MSIITQAVKSNRFTIILAVFCMSVSLIADLMIPWLLQILIDDGITKHNAEMIQQIGIQMLAATIISLIACTLAYHFSATSTAKIGEFLRKKLYTHILSLPYEAFNSVSASTLITRLTNDVLQIQNMFLMVQRIAIGLPISFIIGLVLSIQLSPSLSLTYLITIPLLCLNIGSFVRFSAKYFPKIQSTLDSINLSAQEMLIGVMTIKGLGAAKKIIRRFRTINDQLFNLNLTIQKRFSIVAPTSMIIFNEAIAVILCLGFFGFTSDIGKLIAFISYSMQILSCVTRASNVLNQITRAQASIQRIQKIINIPIQTEISTPILPDGWTIEVKNLFYHFPHSKQCQLYNVCCKIPFNQRVGIVGLPGSGKTLFLDAISGLLDNIQGDILYEGVSLQHVPRKWLMNNIGYVQQNATVLAGTIRDNLLLGNPNLTISDITKALDDAMASELYLSNQKSIEHAILQRGHDLSGGQKQRLSIARILALQPKILILDDSTSALDHETERAFFSHLDAMRPQTQIIVSQRLSTLRKCDIIYLFDRGQIVAQGPHANLISSSSLYEMILGDQMIEEALNEQ
ncbi:MAG: ABC transporter ATP-binding protein [Peptococcaceae bacterium]|nr:ABC transporter ATP-binding protein [Peptococcaceae bacterium]